MKIIVIGSRAYNELVGRIEKIEAAIAASIFSIRPTSSL